jgi:O-antigen ligase
MQKSNNRTTFFSNPATIYIIFWFLYRLQDIWYQAGGVISQMILFTLILVSLWHALCVYSSSVSKPLLFKGLVLMIIMYTIYGIILIFTDGAVTKGIRVKPPTYYYLKNYYVSLLPIISFYYFTIKGYLNQRLLRIWVPLFIALGLIEYYHWQQMIAIQMSEMGLDETNTNNMGYIMVALIPALFVFNKAWWQYVVLGVCILFALFSMKRGAIICGFLLSILYILMNMKSARSGKKVVIFFLITIISIFILNILQDTLFQNDFFQRRLEKTLEGDSSGRDVLYKFFLFFFIYRASPIEKLLGIGADGTIKISFNYAHNDWLEILINQGMVGIFCYVLYWCFFIITVKKRKYSRRSKNILVLVLVFTFVKSLFSMSIGSLTIYTTSIFGYALADGFSRDNNTFVQNR